MLARASARPCVRASAQRAPEQSRRFVLRGVAAPVLVGSLLNFEGERPSLDDASKFAVRLPEEYIAVIARCWRADALERPTMEDIAPELERMFFAEKRLVIESKKRAVEAAPSLMP